MDDVDGQEAHQYSDADGSLWIASKGEPHVLKFQGFEGSQAGTSTAGTMKFSDWNDVDRHLAQAKAEVVSIPGLS